MRGKEGVEGKGENFELLIIEEIVENEIMPEKLEEDHEEEEQEEERKENIEGGGEDVCGGRGRDLEGKGEELELLTKAEIVENEVMLEKLEAEGEE